MKTKLQSLLVTLQLILLLATYMSFAQTSHNVYVSKGRTIHYTVTRFSPPVQITPDNGGLDQNTATDCVRLYWSRLKDLDIKGAAQLYVNPQHEMEARMKYKERVGDKMFREMHSKVFESNRFTHELVIGSEHALVSQSRPGTMMLLRVRAGKFFLESMDDAKQDESAQDLMTLVNAHDDGKLNLE